MDEKLSIHPLTTLISREKLSKRMFFEFSRQKYYALLILILIFFLLLILSQIIEFLGANISLI